SLGPLADLVVTRPGGQGKTDVVDGSGWQRMGRISSTSIQGASVWFSAPAVELWVRRFDDRAMRIRAVRARPATGPTGNAKPIQNANSSGSNVGARTVPACRCCTVRHPCPDCATQTG